MKLEKISNKYNDAKEILITIKSLLQNQEPSECLTSLHALFD